MKKILSILFLAISIPALAADFYVNPSTGNDQTGSGTPAAPFKSYLKAQGVATAGDRILLAGGLEHPVDNIYQDRAVTITSYGGSQAILSGWLTATSWTNAGGGIYYVTDAGFQNLVTQLQIDGVEYAKGSFPRSSWLNISGRNVAAYSDFVLSGAETAQVTTNSSLTGIPAGLASSGSTELVLRSRRTSVDRYLLTASSGSTFTYGVLPGMATAYAYSPILNYGFKFQNHLSLLTQFGDWMFDPATKRVYVYFGSEAPSAHIVKISKSLRAFNAGTAGTTFNNVKFDGYNNWGVYVTGGSISFVSCTFEHCGFYAIYSTSTNGGLVDGCTFDENPNTAIELVFCNSWTIQNSTIKNTCALQTMGGSNDSGYGIHAEGTGIRILGNTILENGFTAIYFKQGDIVVQNNYVDGFCKTRDDGGGIYTFEGDAQISNTAWRYIRNNVVANGYGNNAGVDPAEELNKAYGYYIDQHASEVELSNNYAENTAGGIFLHNPHNLVLRGNILYGNDFGHRFRTYAPENPISGVVVRSEITLAKAGQKLFYVDTDDDVLTFGSVDSCQYYTTDANGSWFWTRAVGGATVQNTFAGWKSMIGGDANGSITNYSSSLSTYNGTGAIRTILTGGVYRTWDGHLVPNAIKLQPYSGTFMFPSTMKIATRNGALLTFLGVYQAK